MISQAVARAVKTAKSAENTALTQKAVIHRAATAGIIRNIKLRANRPVMIKEQKKAADPAENNPHKYANFKLQKKEDYI